MSAVWLISARASGSGLPCSIVSVREIPSARSRISSAVFLRIFARSQAVSFAQAGIAFFAASIAFLQSSRVPNATSAIDSSVAGLFTAFRFPEEESTHWPLR